ncbi:hypothetical protein FHY25_001517 [Xanthomonas arboricola]|uniref:hypothetical protein n=1 Tax=Xanthomonas TaxID=338 RepID=UPI000E1E93D6|nr:hypothetical protein [Xanthomonas arboricola]MCW1981601.1 hypothetical protein [Xanthomonas campestris]MCW2006936.1 hypothetical protein [Xanthomonas campestris]
MTNKLSEKEVSDQRLDAIELVLEVVLPLLISNSPNQKQIRRQLMDLAQAPPAHMSDNTALPLLLDAIESACPDNDASPL